MTNQDDALAFREKQRRNGRKNGHGAASRDDDPPESDSPTGTLPQSGDPEVDATMAAYCSVAGVPRFWSDIKACEQVRAEVYRTRAAARADAVERKELLTIDQARARDESLAALVKDQLARISELIATLVAPEQAIAAQKAARAWASGVLVAIADAIEKR